MSKVIAWENPPRDWKDEVAEAAAELRDRPFEWALLLKAANWDDVADWEEWLLDAGDFEVRVDRKEYAYQDLYARSLKSPTTWRDV